MMALGKHEEALTVFEKTLKFDPSYDVALCGTGVSLTHLIRPPSNLHYGQGEIVVEILPLLPIKIRVFQLHFPTTGVQPSAPNVPDRSPAFHVPEPSLSRYQTPFVY